LKTYPATGRLETCPTARALMKLLAPLGKNPRKMQGATVVNAISTAGASALKGSTHPARDRWDGMGHWLKTYPATGRLKTYPTSGRLETYPLSEDSSGKQGLSTPVDTGIDTVDPNLVKVIDAWPTLPEPIRRAMLALIG
jgi:hypothetical protein